MSDKNEKYKFNNLLEAIDVSIEKETGIMFINENDEHYITYKELYNNSMIILHGLQEKGLNPGDELIFQVESNEEFTYLFWACLLGGIIPIPVPTANTEEQTLKLQRIWTVLNDPYLITNEKSFNRILQNLDVDHRIKSRTIVIDNISMDKGYGIRHTPKSSDIAFIQFSSGSTGDPKGVILTHENLITNIRAILNGMNVTEKDSTLSWVPMTHDLGLVGLHLCPLVAGINQCIMQTAHFIKNPISWIDNACQYKSTLLASPNFGYNHFLKFYNPDIDRSWDLSNIRLLINGAEPISAELSDKFYIALDKWKLNKKAAFPVYGLAEATLAVTFPPLGEGLTPVYVNRNSMTVGQCIEERDNADINSITFVDLGVSVQDCKLKICDDQGQKLEDGRIGNVLIKGVNVTRGYYNCADKTSKLIDAEGWLNTGDIGFIRNSRLVITGRSKDIIFINGQNYYPHDIERIACQIGDVQADNIAVCGVYNSGKQTEQIAVFILYNKDIEEFTKLAIRLKRHINKITGLDVEFVIPVKELSRTVSGKIQRYKVKENYDNGLYEDIIAQVRSLVDSEFDSHKETVEVKNPMQRRLIEIWSDILKTKNINIYDSFFELGGDSLKASYIISNINKEFNIDLGIADLFEKYTVELLAQYIETLTVREYAVIKAVDKREFYEASSAQKRMYTLQQLEEGSTAYNITQAIVIKGKLNIDKFKASLNKVVSRHESLRTSFFVKEGILYQLINDDIRLDFSCIEAKKEDVEFTIRKFVRPYNLTEAPLFRACLITISDEKHIFVFDIHHIICDGISVSIIFNEMMALYRDQELSSLEFQYKEYSEWHNANVNSPDIKSQEEFWLNEFKGEIPLLNLPTDYIRPSMQSFGGDKLGIIVESDLLNKLKLLSAKKKTSLYMVLLSAYYILLSKYSGQEDIIVGSTASGREYSEFHNTVGMFVNTVAVKSSPKGEKSFADYLVELKSKLLQIHKNQFYPFETLIEKLNIRRDMSRNPLFDTMFVMQNFDMGEYGSHELEVEFLKYYNRISKFDLTLFAQEISNELELEFEYCTELYKKSTISRMAYHYINILEQITNDFNIMISDIQVSNKQEYEEAVYRFNDSKTEYPGDKTIQELFEEKAREMPDNIAVAYENERLTYYELNERADNLAKVLRKKGIGKDSIVGIMAERSIELIVGIMGVLKAGGAYLPIDPEYPKERIRYMLHDSGVQILITQGHLKNKADFNRGIIELDKEALYGEDSSSLENINDPNDLAYIIYTSGSTGKPKGVMIEHRSVVNYAWWAIKNYVKGEILSFPLYTSISFDLTVTSVFAPLLSGNTIIIYKENDKDLPIQRVLKDNCVDIIKLTPAHLRIIKDMDNSNSRIKRFIVGGEQLETAIAKSIHDSFNGDIEIFNEYGPTEATVGCMIYKYNSQSDLGHAVSIGIPADNAMIYILDKYLKPVPDNVIGELYISGDGLARGYLNKPELTSEKFIPNPFMAGMQMYKTGDLAKRLTNGLIEYAGRADEQIKIKGYRIELGEIEDVLKKHEAVNEAVVLAKESNGEKNLCAYLVANGYISIENIKGYLADILPVYMVPSFFIQLDKLPLSNNGKVDRSALLELTEAKSAISEYVEPRNEIEKILAAAWEQVLKVDKVGVSDNYYSLGGDSIKAIQIVSKLSQAGININVKDILRHQTISQICLNLGDNLKRAEYEQGIVNGRIGLTPIYKWFFNHKLNNPNYYNQSVLFETKRPIRADILEKALAKVINHHDGLRVNYDSKLEELYYNEKHLGERFVLSIFDLSTLSDEESKIELSRVCINLKSGFDITESLLIKAALIICNNRQYVFITAHHLVIDGVSWRILIEDLNSAYDAIEKGMEVILPKKTASLKDWYDGLIAYAQGSNISKAEEYWNYIKNSDAAVTRSEEISDYKINKAFIEGFALAKEETEILLEKSNKVYNARISDLIVAALAMTFSQLMGREEVILEMESHGRSLDDVDVSRTIGWFTSLYSFTLDIPQKSIENTIIHTKEQLRSVEKYAFDYGVIEYMKNSLNCTNIFPEIRFNYLGQFDETYGNDLLLYSYEEHGSDICSTNPMTAGIEVNCMTINDSLNVHTSFNGYIYDHHKAEMFRNEFLENIRRIINVIGDKNDICFTPSDFETIEIGQEDLDELFS